MLLAQADEANQCGFPKADYIECLHHGEEVWLAQLEPDRYSYIV